MSTFSQRNNFVRSKSVFFLVAISNITECFTNVNFFYYKFFKNLITKYRFRKFYKKSYKKLSLLSNFLNDSSTVDDVTANVDFCLKLQTIIRDYFAVRFFSGIYNMTTEEITKYLTENIEKFLPGNLTLFFYDVMSKCDAVRFSGNIDEKKNLTAEDKKMLIEKSYSILNGIHTGVPFDADI